MSKPAKHESLSGGTKMWCTTCKSIRVCKAIPIPARLLGTRSGQRWFKKDHPDLHWFRRGRECLTCGRWFITAEAGEDFLDELCELRATLGEIKQNAEQYRKESHKAATSLRRLEKSLGVLRALKSYKSKDA